jgi:hypothetical protein
MDSASAFPEIHADVLTDAAVITTGGSVLRAGNGRCGIILVDETDHRPVLHIDETSDDRTINLFLRPTKDSSPIVRSDEGDGQFYEMLINR